MKKNLLAKIVAGILVSAMSVSVFAGCGDKDKDAAQTAGANLVDKKKPDKPKNNTEKVLRILNC